MSILPVETDNKFIFDVAESVIENILPLLPDTPSIVDPLPIRVNGVTLPEDEITALPFKVNEFVTKTLPVN